MIQVRLVAVGLLCSLAPFAAAFGQAPAGKDAANVQPPATVEPDPAPLMAPGVANDLTTDFSRAFTSAPLASDGPAAALQATDAYVFDNGPYVIGYIGTSTIDGDLDGTTILSAPDLPDLLFVPELDTGVGFGIGLGYRIDEFAFEFNFMRTMYDTDFGGVPFDEAALNAFNFDVKYFFSLNDPLQPFILAGLVLPWLDVENGSVDPGPPRTSDASYTGVGANLGGGFNFYLTPQIALVVQGGYRIMYFTSVKGASDDRRSVNDNLDASGFFASGGISFSF